MLFVALTSSKHLADRKPNTEPCDGNTFQQSQFLEGEEHQDWPHGLCFQRWLLLFGAQLSNAKLAGRLFGCTEQPRELLSLCQDAECSVPLQTQPIY